MPGTKDIHNTPMTVEQTPQGNTWRHLDLGGDHLGVRIESLAPGESSSVHHYHTAEEEHVLMLDGEATLYLGDKTETLSSGDHYWFAAGVEDAHHLENTGDMPCRYLIFGERNANDVVVYPEHQVMMLKSLEFRQFTYRPR